MAILTDKKYLFVSKALPEKTFSVMKFMGAEALSSCYDFSILLASENMDVDLEDVLASTAVFTIRREGGDVHFNGVLKSFEQRHAYGGYAFYHAELTPRLWRLSQTVHNRVFLDMTLPDILTEVLKAGGLDATDFELRLQGDYQAWEYVCQYNETYLDFMSRWMERDGIYYFFEQSESREKLILTDSKLSHAPRPHGDKLTYALPSALDGTHLQEIIQTFTCSQRPVPANVILKDYNYRTPSLELTGRSEVADNGQGDVYIYGEHFRTPEEGDQLASIRAEEFLCQETRFLGEGRVPYVQPGYSFNLGGHYRSDFDGKYVTIEVHHEGSQTEYLSPGIRSAFEDKEIELTYYNLFKAVPADRQFRPARETPKTRFNGIMNAKIDAAGSGDYAKLDEMGRYKVILPFDISGRKDGKASAWLRMMQPHAGSGEGMHFPLHKGTEVVLTFIDGDPDRPIIAGAVPNPEHPSPVAAENQTQCRLTTAGGNRLHFEDRTGKERITAASPTADATMTIGAADPATGGGSAGSPYPSAADLIQSAMQSSQADSTGAPEAPEGLDSFPTESHFVDSPMAVGTGFPATGTIVTTMAAASAAIPYDIPDIPTKVVDDPKDIKFSDHDREWAFLDRDEDGITLATTQGFDLKAGTYNALVLGEETSLTAGAYAKTNIGEKTSLHFGSDLDIFIGAKTDFKTGWHWQTFNSVAHMRWFRRKLSLAEEIVQGETTQLHAQVTQVIASSQEAVGEANKARGSLNKVTGQANKAVGQLNRTQGKVDKVTGSLEQAIGDASEAKENASEVCGEATIVAGACDGAEAQKNRMVGEIIGSLVSVTQLTVLKSRISGVDAK